MKTTKKNDVDALLKARAEIDEQLRRHKNNMTVLFTDIVGSTSFFERNGDTAGLAMIHRHDELTSAIVSQYKGRIIKTIGDSAMAEFPDPPSAVRAALEIERQFLKLNATLQDGRNVEVRIGIHSGMGFRRGNDLFGDVVNVAARITKRAAPAQILTSKAVQESLTGETDIKCQWLSTFTLDGRTEKEDIYEVIWTDSDTYIEIRDRLTVPSGVPERYEVLSQLGTGGTGIVYKVRDHETGELVALKMLKPELAADPAIQENLKRELCLARRITHKNVCRIYEFSRTDGQVFTSMELVEGESLLSKLYRAGALPIPEAVDIVKQICAGLREAHEQGIIHRDLKPANIMLNRSGTVKIMDFGIARLIQGSDMNNQFTGTIVGTPAYMAPEQAELKPVSAGTDIYALGLVFYEMVTGSPAFSGDTPVSVALKQIREYPKRPSEIVPAIPFNIEDTILKCLEKDPAHRFQAVGDLEDALENKIVAKPQSTWKETITPELVRFKLDIQQFAKSASIDARAFLVRHADKIEPLKTRKSVALGAGLLVLALGGVTVHGSRKAHSSADLNAATPMPQIIHTTPNSSVEVSGAVSLMQATPVSMQPVALNNVSVTGPSEIEKILDAPDDSDLRTTPKTKAARKPLVRVKSPAPAKVSGAVLASNHPVLTPEPMPLTANPSAVSPALSAAPVANTAEKNPAVAEHAASEETPGLKEDKPKSGGVYFEVGSFKDEMWAQNAVEKLTDLGFQASYVHKTTLWMQNYRVQVGPYTDPSDAEANQKKLTALGYKVRIHPQDAH